MMKGLRTAVDSRLVVVLAAAFVVALGLAVWLWLAGRPPGEGSAEAGFARDMVVHHAQAVEMAEIVRDRTENEDIRLLASDISLTQQGQIGIMQGWLGVWGLPTAGTKPAMAWMGHPMEGLMPGMATPDEITRLSQLPPDRADVLFLRLMIAHHEAAIPMAQAILKRTDEPEVRQLAQSIQQSQRVEIANMKAMVEDRVGDSAQVDLEPANGSRTSGSATLSKTDGGVKVVLDVSGLPDHGTMYLTHIHPGTCGQEEGGGQGHSAQELSAHEHGAFKEIEYPLSPVDPDKKGEGSSSTVVRQVTLEDLLSEDPMYVNVHPPGSGDPLPVTCANLNEARWPCPTGTRDVEGRDRMSAGAAA
jgi:uncharacterized protein (DUF305 family)